MRLILIFFIVLTSCNSNENTMLFEDIDLSNKKFDYKLNKVEGNVFQFTFTYPYGLLVKQNKFYSILSINWYLKRSGSEILFSQDKKNFKSLFWFDLKSTNVKLFSIDGVELKVERSFLRKEKDSNIFMFKLVDYGCILDESVVSQIFSWCDLVFIISERKGFFGLYLSLSGQDRIFDSQYNEYIYYPLGDLAQYMDLDSAKLFDKNNKWIE